MKHTYLFTFALIATGCSQQPQQQPIIIQQPPIVIKQEAPPVAPPVAAPPVILRSSSYVTGYNDGYYRVWLSPLRWTFGEDYRNGWSAGDFDRFYGRPNKYPR